MGKQDCRITRRALWMAAVGMGLSADAGFDRYGGYRGLRRKATGYFRVERIRGRWMLVTPEGNGYVALGANHVGAYFGSPQAETLMAQAKGDRKAAEERIHEAMLNMGLNAGEAYAPLLESLAGRLPHVANVTFPGASKFAFDVFDPEFQERLRAHVERQCKQFARNPWVIGLAFADLPVWDERRIDYFQALPDYSAGKKKFVEYLSRSGATGEGFLGSVADVLYQQLRNIVQAAAPGHLFLGERFVLRQPPEPVVSAVARHVNIFCTQALILSPQRPPEWQVFQPEGYRRTYKLAHGKPMIIIDWAAPFSLDSDFEPERGRIYGEQRAAEQAALWIESAFEEPYVVGVFKCQLIGSHGNDRWFPSGGMKRTYLQDNGEPFRHRTEITRRAHAKVLQKVYGLQ